MGQEGIQPNRGVSSESGSGANLALNNAVNAAVAFNSFATTVQEVETKLKAIETELLEKLDTLESSALFRLQTEATKLLEPVHTLMGVISTILTKPATADGPGVGGNDPVRNGQPPIIVPGSAG